MPPEVKKCWFCGEIIKNENEVFEIDTKGIGPTQYWHKKCAEMQGMDKESSYDFIKSDAASQSNKNFNTTALDVLRFFSWVTLVFGVIGAIFIWSTMATIEVPYSFVSGTHTETNPVGIALGFVSLFQGVLGYVLLQVICSMADSLIEIRQNIN